MMCAVHRRWTLKGWAECILGKGLWISKGTCHCTRNGVALKCGPPFRSEGPQLTKVRGLWVGCISPVRVPERGRGTEAAVQQKPFRFKLFITEKTVELDCYIFIIRLFWMLKWFCCLLHVQYYIKKHYYRACYGLNIFTFEALNKVYPELIVIHFQCELVTSGVMAHRCGRVQW